MSPISFLNDDVESDQEIGDDSSETTGDCTWSSDIDEEDKDYQQDVLSLSQ
jgi:hypothetical protein